MPKVTPQHELDQLLALITAQPYGLGIDAISETLNGSIPRRTLQRRLAHLVEQGQLRMQGEARAVRYVRTAPVTRLAIQQSDTTPQQAYTEAYVPTSPEGEEIKAYVRQARQLRRPIGYQLTFLEQYHPNQSAYLPQKLRTQLHMLGRSPAAQTPAGTFA
eukprot:gene43586-54725_t